VNVLSFNDGGAALGTPDAGGYFLMLISPGELTRGEVAGKDIVFVLDTSGSMAEHAKIKQACKALQYCVGSLNAGDRFQVIRFATDVEPLFGGLVDPSDANRARAAHYIEGLHAAGATALDDALAAAVGALAGRKETDRPAAIIFLTDGQPTVGEVNEDNIVAHLGRVIGDRVCPKLRAVANSRIANAFATNRTNCGPGPIPPRPSSPPRCRGPNACPGP
jgi:hypothetical protein